MALLRYLSISRKVGLTTESARFRSFTLNSNATLFTLATNYHNMCRKSIKNNLTNRSVAIGCAAIQQYSTNLWDLGKYRNYIPQQHLYNAQYRQKSTQLPKHNIEGQLSRRQITKNLTFYTKTPCNSEIDAKTLELKEPTGNPLVLIMAWLMARQKHVRKYAELYTEMGFDAIVVQVTPWQLLWPTQGTQVVAVDTLNFLEYNKSYSSIVMHGFSVGAYQFGEMMLLMSRDMERYQPLLNRFVSQVWDSAADITEIPVGLPKSIFPKNPRMQNVLRSYTLYHMKKFYNQATVHYMRSSQMFHSTLLKAPAIFFVAENDAIGPPKSNQSVREDWERANIPVTFKCWERSAHAAHFMKHREEYLELLYKHLEASCGLETAAAKSRAKL